MNDNNNTRVYLTESLSTPREKKPKKKEEGSFLATFLKILGAITVISGVVLGIFLANSSEITALKELLSSNSSISFNILVMVACWGLSLVSGMILIGMGELIRLLQSMNDNLK